MSSSPRRILGIDPGLETTGFGVIEWNGHDFVAKDFGIFHTKKTDSPADRLHQIAGDFTEILTQWKPDLVAFEKLVFVKNVTSGLLVAQARGVLLERCAAEGIPFSEFLPTAVKKAVTGNGNAPKIQVGRMVQMILKLPQIPTPDDAADALAIALTGAKNPLLFS